MEEEVTQALLDMRVPATSHIDRLFRYFENTYRIDPYVKEKLRESPCVAALDRIMAFRSDPWYGELRAALDRIERGCYGMCTVCRTSISAEKLRRSPTARICDSCAGKFGLEGFDV